MVIVTLLSGFINQLMTRGHHLSINASAPCLSSSIFWHTFFQETSRNQTGHPQRPQSFNPRHVLGTLRVSVPRVHLPSASAFNVRFLETSSWGPSLALGVPLMGYTIYWDIKWPKVFCLRCFPSEVRDHLPTSKDQNLYTVGLFKAFWTPWWGGTLGCPWPCQHHGASPTVRKR